MHFAPSEEQAAFLDGLRRLLDDLGGRELVRSVIDSESGVETTLWDTLADLGVLGLAVAEQRGGQGAGWLDCCLALEVLSTTLCEGPLLMHLLAVTLLDRFGGAAQHDRWLGQWLSGQQRATVMFAELGQPVAFADKADAIIVAANGQLWCVPTDTEGVVIDPVPTIDPAWRCADVTISESALAQSQILPASTHTSIEQGRDLLLSALACAQAGMARHSLAMATEYACDRQQFGRAIGTFQAVQHRCADMFVGVETARSTAWYAAWCCDHLQTEVSEAAAVAASWCSDTLFSVTADSLQVHGGIGFTWEHDCHLFFKRAEITRRLVGDSRAQRTRLAATLGL